jgi:hypothetical protein
VERKRQPRFKLAEWSLPLEADRELVDLWKDNPAPAFRVLFYADEEWLQRGDFAIPRQFFFLWNVEASSTSPRIALRIVIERGEPVCDWLSIERRTGGAAITGTNLRELRLSTLVRAAAQRAGGRVARRRRGSAELRPAVFLDAAERERFRETIGEGRRTPRRGKRLQHNELERVAEVYRLATERGMPPTQAVREAFHVSYPTAGRWVHEARNRGLLPKTTRGVPAAEPPVKPQTRA